MVPAFNEERLLGKSLEHLHAGMALCRERGWSTELIVCDNNSTDRSAEIARAAGATVVFEPVNQIARARNRGAAEATGDWLLFVDADSWPSRALFADMLERIESGECIGGGSTIAFPQAAAWVKLWVLLWNAFSRATSWAAGSFFFCEARAFREVGAFSEALYASEELDLSRKLKRLGRRSRRRFVILHRHPLATSDRKARLYGVHEHLRFFLRTLFTGGRALRRREDCFVWYDGRR